MEPGENIIEIQFSQLSLTDDALKSMCHSEPIVFVTMEFFDFEMQTTPMLHGPEYILIYIKSGIVFITSGEVN